MGVFLLFYNWTSYLRFYACSWSKHVLLQKKRAESSDDLLGYVTNLLLNQMKGSQWIIQSRNSQPHAK